jgi:hypothetical protein
MQEKNVMSRDELAAMIRSQLRFENVTVEVHADPVYGFRPTVKGSDDEVVKAAQKAGDSIARELRNSFKLPD